MNGATSDNGVPPAAVDWTAVPPVPPLPLLAAEEVDRTAHKRELHTVNVGELRESDCVHAVGVGAAARNFARQSSRQRALRSDEHQPGYLRGQARRLHLHRQQVRRFLINLAHAALTGCEMWRF